MNVRECVFNCLKKIFIDNAYANIVLQHDLDRLEQNDKNLATRIIYGTIQNYRLLAYQWENLVEKLPNKQTCILINMSVYQLLMMDKVPSYAIINEANKLAKPKYKGLVNAILHKVDKQGLIKSGNLGIDYSLEDWLVNLFKAHYDNYEEIFSEFLKESIIYGRMNTLKCSSLPYKFIDDTCFVGNYQLINDKAFKEGLYIIQDYASQQVAKQMDIVDNLDVLDLCSAPGSKSFDIAMMMHNTGNIIACDLYEHRLNLIKERSKILGIDCIETQLNDATILNKAFIDKFDRVLVDAPCSGLGVLKRKPDIKLKIKPENLDEIVNLQKKILDNAAKYVKVNGILIYSTCTLNKKENERQIAQFINSHLNFELLDEKTILPFENDGFYHAKLVRKI